METSVAAGSQGGRIVKSAGMLELLAFLASAAAILPLQEVILSASVAEADGTAVSNIKST